MNLKICRFTPEQLLATVQPLYHILYNRYYLIHAHSFDDLADMLNSEISNSQYILVALDEKYNLCGFLTANTKCYFEISGIGLEVSHVFSIKDNAGSKLIKDLKNKLSNQDKYSWWSYMTPVLNEDQYNIKFHFHNLYRGNNK